MKTRRAVLDGIRKELELRRTELPAEPVPSVYFGGGTPSLLTEAELEQIFEVLYRMGYLDETTNSDAVPLRSDAGTVRYPTSAISFPEITLEANPDDLTGTTIRTLAASPVNRLSIGIQSFFEEDLRFMNRAHNAEEARSAVEKVNHAGFDDVSIDLIYGGQTTSNDMWAENLRTATDLGVTHVSAYALTVEPKTALGVNVAKGKVPDTDDAKFDRHFNMLVDHLAGHGFRHYEVSNFCQPGHESRHNSGYWSGQPYLGIGPGAHGFDGTRTRKWNVANNAAYAKAWAEINSPEEYAAAGGFLYDTETLTDADRYNEFIMTGLRRDTGVSLSELERLFGPGKAVYFADSQRGNVAADLFGDISDGVYRLSRAGIMRADGIGADGFWVS